MSHSDSQNKSQKLLIGTLIYAVGTFGPRLLNFFIVPFYTYYISPADMGDYELIISNISLLTPLITLQISDGAYTWMMRDQKQSGEYITAVYKFITFTSLLVTGVMIAINFFFPIAYFWYFLGLLIVSRLFQTIQKLLRGLNNQKLVAISGILNTLVFLVLNVIQVVVFDMGIIALFQSTIVGNIVGILAMLIFEKRLRRISKKEKSFPIQKSMLKFSIPLIPNRLNWWAISSLNKYFIKFFIGSAANGIYGVANKFPSILQMLYNIFYESWQDTAVGDKDDSNDGFYTNVFRYYYKLSFTMLLFLIPFTKLFICFVMDERYISSAEYISFLYLGTVFQAFSSFFGVGYLKSDQTKKAGITSVAGAVINAVANLLLIKVIGLHAASISTFIAFFVMFVLRAYHTKSVMKVKVKWSEFFALFSISLVVTVLGVFSGVITDACLCGAGLLLFIALNFKEIKMILKKGKKMIVKR